MKKALTTQQAMRYSRQILLAGFDLEKQEILLNSRICLIGVGGLGCAASQYLVAAGIGKLTLIDDDIVELTNLQRQVLHFERSVGVAKVDSACSTLRQLNSDVELCKITARQTEKQLTSILGKHDIVIDCSDNLLTRNLLNRVCYAKQTPLISGAAIRMEGQIFCMQPSEKTACYACISQFFGEQELSCVESGVMSPVVGIIGAMQALEAIKTLCSYGQPALNKLLIFDGIESRWETIKVKRNQNCQICSRPSIQG